MLDPNTNVTLTKPPTQYSANYPYIRLNDLATDKYWLSKSNNFINNAIYKFDENNSTKSFNTFKLYNKGDSASIKHFALLGAVDSNLSTNTGKKGWTRAISDSSLNQNINF